MEYNMVIDKLKYINVRRLLNRIINDSQIVYETKSFTYDDIKGALLPETVESRITEALRILVCEGILQDKGTLLGRPPKYLRNKDECLRRDKTTGRKPNCYEITQSQSAFKKIFHIYLDEEIEKFLASLYTDNIIKNYGFSCVYEVINPDLERFDFRQIASNSLLTQSAVKREYKGQSKLRDEYLLFNPHETSGQSSKEINLFDLVIESPMISLWDERRAMLGSVNGCRIRPIRSNRIKILSQFDPKKAVAFYRDTIQVDIQNLFSELYERSLITRSLNQFMEYDIHLSPFTSYPFKSPSDLLFSNPFQRIFADVYLLNEADVSKFYKRALTVYEHFGDILFEYFRNNIGWIAKIEPWINQFIFQWNVARTNFDSIWDYLGIAYTEGIGSGRYHVYIKGVEILVTDLETNKPLPFLYERKINLDTLGEKSEEVFEEYLFPPTLCNMSAAFKIYSDPYRNIVSCECFENDCPTSITYEQIFSDIKSRFAENGWDYDAIE
jgi:hypothetical protein